MQRFELLVPHLRRAVLIGRLIEQHRTDAARLSEVLDTLRTGILLVARTGRLTNANHAGRRLLDARDGLSLASGRLRFTDANAQRRLMGALRAAGSGVVTEEGQLLAIRRRKASPLAAHILPLQIGRDPSARAVAAIFVRSTDFDADRAVAAMGEVYQLTAAEQKVVRAIADGGGVKGAVSSLGISAATARTHLAHVFQKTGAKGQAEIVRMLGGYGGPIG